LQTPNCIRGGPLAALTDAGANDLSAVGSKVSDSQHRNPGLWAGTTDATPVFQGAFVAAFAAVQ